ncbi:hypothetical protein HY497_01255 [Candidatus Woesearchaeota archaeon]|nr:hypothetical protein [Candidatus Woesearchaeota archaeon]
MAYDGNGSRKEKFGLLGDPIAYLALYTVAARFAVAAHFHLDPIQLALQSPAPVHNGGRVLEALLSSASSHYSFQRGDPVYARQMYSLSVPHHPLRPDKMVSGHHGRKTRKPCVFKKNRTQLPAILAQR